MSTKYKNADIVRDRRKFPCLLCEVAYRTRRETRSHMEQVHAAEFEEHERTERRMLKRKYADLLTENAEAPDRNLTTMPVAGTPIPENRKTYLHENDINANYSDCDVTQDSININFTVTESGFNSNVNALPDNNQNDPDGYLNGANNEVGENNNQPPHYVEDHDENAAYMNMALYKCNGDDSISRRDHIIACISYAERQKICGLGLIQLIDLVALHLPDGTHVDKKIKRIKNILGYDDDNLTKNYYCGSCRSEWDMDRNTCSTPRCDSLNTEYFVSDDMIKQFTLVLTRKGIWDDIMKQKSLPSGDSIKDIYDGKFYKVLKQEGNFLHGCDNTNITLTVFHDGVSLYKSTNISIWPLFMVINELPKKKRFSQENVILWSVFQQKGKPDCKFYFKKFKEAIDYLYTNGITIRIDDKVITVKCLPFIFTQDLAARAFMLYMRSHGADLCCHLCTIKGTEKELGLQKRRSYDPFEVGIQQRTLADIKKNAAKATQNKPVAGFYGYSPVWDLPHFTQHAVQIDYMHNICIGTIGKLYQGWFEKPTCAAYLGLVKDQMCDRLLLVKPTKQITRLLTGFNYWDWKASQSRAYILYYGLFTMEDLVSEDVLKHFALFVEGTFLILKDDITEVDLTRAHYCFTQFVRLYEVIYANPNELVTLTLNMHNLTHLAQCVDKFGPCSLTSAFPMESHNGAMMRQTFGTSSVKHQLFWVNYMAKMCASHSSNTTNERVQEFLRENKHKGKFSEGVQCEDCAVHGRIKKCNKNEKRLIRAILHTTNYDNFKHAEKIVANDTYFDSADCKRIKRRCTFYIQLSKKHDMDLPDVIRVQSYIVRVKERVVYACGTPYKFGRNIVPGIAPNCRYLEKEEYVSKDWFYPIFKELYIHV